MRPPNDDNRPALRTFRSGALALSCLALFACDGAEELDDMELDSEGFEDEIDLEEEEGESSDLFDDGDPDDVDVDVDHDYDIDLDFESEVDPMGIAAQGYASWGTPGNNGAPLDLGPSNGRTCFLQGVSGQLRAPQWAASNAQARVSVYKSGGHWWLETQAGDGSGAMGYATCIPTDYNQRSFSWLGNTGNGAFADQNARSISAGPFTRCFLTSVWGTTGWGSASSYTKLWEQGGRWWLGGNLIKQQDSTSGGGSAAVCVDIWQTSSDYGWQTSNNNSGAVAQLTPEDDAVCSVHRLVGNFAHDSTGWSDGARLFPQTGWWKVFSSNGKGIFGECIYNINWGF